MEEKKLPYSKKQIKELIKVINTIITQAKKTEKGCKALLEKVHPKYRHSAVNLLHYWVFRQNDISASQVQLGHLGLSRLAKLESHVLASMKANLAILKALLNETPINFKHQVSAFKKGRNLLSRNRKDLLGARTKGRRTRIMVTLPSEAAVDYQLVLDMVEAGMNVARVNCAHDHEVAWKKMIDHVRLAAQQLNRDCKVAMDLAGPKIRTGAIVEGPRISKLKTERDIRGNLVQPLQIWIGDHPRSEFPFLPVAREFYHELKALNRIYLLDTRGKRRMIEDISSEEEGFWGLCHQNILFETGMVLYADKHLSKPIARIGEVPPVDNPIILKMGDILRLDKWPIPGENAKYDESGELVEKAHISCTAPRIFDEVRVGERILFDDGKIEGVIQKVDPEFLEVEITYTSDLTAKLMADKGINFPNSQLSIRGLTEKDRKDLPFVAANADIVNFSFVNSPVDVRDLIAAIDQLGAKEKLGLILKIETQSGFNHLLDILIEAMQMYPIGVMIARGDLAIESGWKNIGRVQEEILAFCQAAHITDIWATQVLEGLAKKGMPSRAEITDAVMAQRADGVMLNKGPHILKAIQLLDSILIDMERYREKNAPLTPKINPASF